MEAEPYVTLFQELSELLPSRSRYRRFFFLSLDVLVLEISASITPSPKRNWYSIRGAGWRTDLGLQNHMALWGWRWGFQRNLVPFPLQCVPSVLHRVLAQRRGGKHRAPYPCTVVPWYQFFTGMELMHRKTRRGTMDYRDNHVKM